MNTIITPTAEELAAILEAHRKWLHGDAGGVRANLADANLAGANLAGANLARANLAGANLAGANLADADLADANLAGANLADADLADADLADANLAGANLAGANLADADLGALSIVPETGAFEGWKSLPNGAIAHLRIPAGAGRVGGLIGRKCRAERAEVLGIYHRGTGQPYVGPVASWHDHNFIYRAGETVTPHEWCDDVRLECAPGIHFFLTRKEAEDYL